MIKQFPEKKIRERILAKIKPDTRKGRRSKHDRGFISMDKIELIIKIPNAHTKEMGLKKSKLLASSLGLSPMEFNRLIECPLTGKDYYELLRIKAEG
jgi:hypothetical protein